MGTRYVGVRIEEELLKLKPENMKLSDWIRECIHAWRLMKEKDLQELFTRIEELTQVGEELRKCPNIDSLKKVADELEQASKALMEYKRIVDNLEWYGEQLKELKKNLQESLIYRPNLYTRSYSYSYRNWDDV